MSVLTFYAQQDFRGGIYDQPEGAQPNQVIDARNVWCPGGRLEQRPGFLAVQNMLTEFNVQNRVADIAGNYYRDDLAVSAAPGPIQAPYLTAGTLASRKTVMGFSSSDMTFSMVLFVQNGTIFNTAKTRLYWEYWNGDRWHPIPSAQLFGTTPLKTSFYTTPLGSIFQQEQAVGFLSSTVVQVLTFVPPADWFFGEESSFPIFGTDPNVRAVLLDNDVVPSSTSAIPFSVGLKIAATANFNTIPFILRDYNGLLSISDLNYSGSTGLTIRITSRPDSSDGLIIPLTLPEFFGTESKKDKIESYVSVKPFDEVYFSYQNRIFRINNYALIKRGLMSPNFTSGDPAVFATLEDDPAIVGTLAGKFSPYHESLLPQLGAYPQGKYLAWYNNIMWIANTTESSSQLRWSAPTNVSVIGYRVWPSICQTELSDSFDNSPITGLSTDSEFLYIFKGDSIWRVVFVTSQPNGAAIYEALKFVSGVGTKAHYSIVQTPAGIFFLYDYGIYQLVGSTVRRISDPIRNTFRHLNAAGFSNAVGCHWAQHHLYLLAVPSAGSAVNDLILAYDYELQAWWIWTCSFGVQSMFVLEDATDKESVYLTDATGYVYTFSGLSDNFGPVEAYIKTHRLGRQDPTRKSFRELRVNGTGAVSDLEITSQVDDTDSPTNGLLNFDDENESHYGTATMTEDSNVTVDSDRYSSVKYRERRLNLRDTGQWCQITITNTTKDRPLQLQGLSLGYVTEGLR